MYSLELFFVASNLDKDWLTIHSRTPDLDPEALLSIFCAVILFPCAGSYGLRPIAQIRLCLACASQEVLFYVAIHPFSELRQNCCHQSHHDFDTFVLLYGFP